MPEIGSMEIENDWEWSLSFGNRTQSKFDHVGFIGLSPVSKYFQRACCVIREKITLDY